MILPGALTSEGLPHALRTIGMIPVVYIFAGIGAIYVYKKIKMIKFFSTNKLARPILFIVLAVVLFSWQSYKYFYVHAKNENLEGAYTTNFVEIGDYLNEQDDIKMYVIVNAPGTPVPWPDGVPVSAQTPMFIEKTVHNTTRATYIKQEDIGTIKSHERALIAPMQPNDDIMNQLKSISPNYQLTELGIIINP